MSLTSSSTSSSIALAVSSTSSISTATSSSVWQSPSAVDKTRSSVPESSFVTQEPLQVKDSSVQVAPKIQALLSTDDYSDVFDSKVLQAQGDFSRLTAWLADDAQAKVESDKFYVESVSKGKRPFLFTGKAKSRTRKNCYLVKIHSTLSEAARAKMLKVFETMSGSIRHNYDLHEHSGFSVCFPPDTLPLALISRMTGVEYVERDQYASVQYLQEEAPWQLARLNNQKCSIEGTTSYQFNATGKGVNVYVIDSGVMVDHPEFGNRARIGYTAFPNFPNDCAGHGTQVSSVIAGTNVGVAKLANIIVTQVLDCDGQGENSAVLAALGWIAANHKKPAVVNMSVGGPKSPSVDDAVRAMVAQGIGVVVAAGNSMIDACSLSPSGVETALVVGATTKDQVRAEFSNFGDCVDVFAPGRHVIAAGIPSQATKNGFMFVSGTSLSAPLVTGLYALLLEANPSLSPLQLKQAVIEASAKGLLKEDSLLGSPNLLVQTSSLPGTSGASFDFVPGTFYPSFDSKAGSSDLEMIFVYIAVGLVALFLIVIAALIARRFLQRRKERKKRKHDVYPSSFQ